MSHRTASGTLVSYGGCCTVCGRGVQCGERCRCVEQSQSRLLHALEESTRAVLALTERVKHLEAQLGGGEQPAGYASYAGYREGTVSAILRLNPEDRKRYEALRKGLRPGVIASYKLASAMAAEPEPACPHPPPGWKTLQIVQAEAGLESALIPAQPAAGACTCSTATLMTAGCQCGGK